MKIITKLNDEPQLQVWVTKTGEFIGEKEFQLGSYDESIGKQVQFSIRNPSDKLWANISKVHAASENNTFIADAVLIAPLGVIQGTYTIGKIIRYGDTAIDLKKNMNDVLKGSISWHEMEKVPID